MPVKKVKKIARVSKSKKNKKRSSLTLFIESLRLGESYTSLVLGVIAVIIATALLLSIMHNSQNNEQTPDATPTIVEGNNFGITATPSATITQQPSKALAATTYTVAAGDNLWKIAERFYKSGYNWVDIAKANNLAQPGDIHVGNKLIIPSATPKVATVVQTVHTADDDQSTAVSDHVKITGTSYTVAHGDDLWEIAVRAYGDGYQWPKIAKANNLSDPDLIHSGNVIKIPRN